MLSRTRIRASPVAISAASSEDPAGAAKPLLTLQSKIQALRLSEMPVRQDRPGCGARSLVLQEPTLSKTKRFTNATGSPVADNTNIMTAGRRGPALLQGIWLIEKLAHFDREVIPERRMHAKGWGAHGTFTVTHDITRYTKAKVFSKIGKQTPMFARFSTVAGERGAADAERDIRGTALTARITTGFSGRCCRRGCTRSRSSCPTAAFQRASPTCICSASIPSR